MCVMHVKAATRVPYRAIAAETGFIVCRVVDFIFRCPIVILLYF